MTLLTPEALTTELVTGSTRLELHKLAMRRDAEEWIVGRPETGEFIALPEDGRRALVLLGQGLPVQDVHARLLAETGTDIDVADFVVAIADLGFVASADGRALPQAPIPRPTLAWLMPQHVRWALHPGAVVGVIALAVAAAGSLALRPALVPSYHDLFWTGQGALVFLGYAALSWLIIGLHELGHLITARAAGVPARMTLGTRLQFLVAQTDVSGVWAAPRRIRLTVYLAGLAVNLVIASACILALAAASPAGTLGRLLGLTALLSLQFIAAQLLVFMRTDVYFVLQELTGTRNLYADGASCLRYWAASGWQVASGRRRGRPADPSRSLAARERRAIRGYCVILLVGTTACIGFACAVTLPAAITLTSRSLRTLILGAGAAQTLDATAAIVLLAGFQVIWLRAWWRRHGMRVRRWLRRILARVAEGR